MSQYANGKTTTDGIVFMYDTGDTDNSYKGEPTTNTIGSTIFNPLDLYTWATSGNTSAWSRDTSTSISPVGGIPLKEISSGTDSYSNTYNNSYYNLGAASAGQTWTVSVYARAAAGTNLQIWLFGANSSGNYIELDAWYFTATGDWQRISGTRTLTNGSTAYVQARVATATNGATVWWDGLQIEQKSHTTPFTPASRSNTQGLLDLSGKGSSIDLANVSFDSSAQIYFDATNDRISLTPSTYGITNQFTIEVVCYPTTQVNGMFNFIGPNGSDRGIMAHWPWSSDYGYLDITNTAGGFYRWYKVNAGILNVKALYHFILKPSGQVVVKQNNNVMIPDGTDTFVGNVSLGTSNTIGAFNPSGGLPWGGNIYVFKVYNRALTDAETTQNYLSYKKRFNLS